MKLLSLGVRLSLFSLFFGFILSACSTTYTSRGGSNLDLDWPFDRFKINQEFGYTEYGQHYASGSHWGIDITRGAGAEVHPIAEGFVVAVGTQNCPDLPDPNCNSGQGNWILIHHPHLKTRSFYGHLKQKPVFESRHWISRSNIIGHEGRSGKIFNLDGSPAGDRSETHLHLSVGDIRTKLSANGELIIAVGQLLDPRIFLPAITKRGR